MLSRTAVVQRDPGGLSPSAQLDAVAAAVQFNLEKPPELRRIEFALPITNTAGSVPGSREEGTATISYLFFHPDVSFKNRADLAQAYAERYASDPGDGLSV